MRKTNLQLRQELAMKYIPYAHNQARLFVNKYSIEYAFDDFKSTAYLGLCRAVKKFNKSKMNINFGQFMPIYVIGALMDEYRKMDLLTRSERKARINGEHVDDVSIQSIEDVTADYDDLYNIIESPTMSLDEMINKQESLKLLNKAIHTLPLPEKIIFCLYVINKHTTYEDIGGIMNMSASRVCQLLNKAKESLKEYVHGQTSRK